MGDLLSRYSYPLTYMVLALASVLSLASQDRPTTTGIASRVLIEFTGPLQQMVTLPQQHFRRAWEGYVALWGVREERDRMARELAAVSQENIRLREALVASERFQRFGDFQAQQDLPLLPATLIGQDLSPYFKSITIDRGTSDGVHPGMPVITDSGIVGVVSGTSPHFARVLLILDPQSWVDAYTQRARVRGSLRGGADGRCTLEQVLREADVEVGDQVLTSGLGGIYPKGMRIGMVAAVQPATSGLFKTIYVRPSVDFSALEEVFVVLERRALPPEEAFTTNDERLWSVSPEEADVVDEAGSGSNAAAEAPAASRPAGGPASPARARQGEEGRPAQARQGQARQGQASPGQASPGQPGQGRAAQDEAGQGRPEQGQPAQGSPAGVRPDQGRPEARAPEGTETPAP